MTATAPESDVELFSEAALADPYPAYDALRDTGAVVWLPELEAYAVARYAEMRETARNWEVFSSAHGVMLNDVVNCATGGRAIICTDPPRHDEMRRVLRRPLMADAVRELTPQLVTEAESLVEGLAARGSFDAVTDLAVRLPLAVISNLVGIPESGRERMLEWAAATFDAMGPDNDRTRAALPLTMEMFDYGNRGAVPPHLKPGGWGQMVYDAADRGEIARDICPSMMSGYLAPSLDTTINGISNAMLLFGEHPDQWALVREDPSLIPNAVNEVLRLESPIQRFSRWTTREHTVDGVTIPADSRVMLLYGAANRDERRWHDPARFDVRRERAAEHLAFGFGPHACVGSNLARLEMRVILEALINRVTQFDIAKPVRAINQTLRGLASLEVTVTG